jgi:cell division protein FtsB
MIESISIKAINIFLLYFLLLEIFTVYFLKIILHRFKIYDEQIVLLKLELKDCKNMIQFLKTELKKMNEQQSYQNQQTTTNTKPKKRFFNKFIGKFKLLK